MESPGAGLRLDSGMCWVLGVGRSTFLKCAAFQSSSGRFWGVASSGVGWGLVGIYQARTWSHLVTIVCLSFQSSSFFPTNRTVRSPQNPQLLISAEECTVGFLAASVFSVAYVAAPIHVAWPFEPPGVFGNGPLFDVIARLRCFVL